MIVKNQKVKVKWNGNNKVHFESKGYRFTKFGEIFIVNVEDLMKSQKVEIKVKCDYCGKEKICMHDKTAKKEQHFCDTSCMFKYKQEREILPPTFHKYNCDYCHKEIDIENYRYERLIKGKYKNLFCSKECSTKWNSQHRSSKKRKLSREKVEIICQNCSTPFLVINSRRDRAKYCCEQCRREAQTKSKLVKCDNCGNEIKKIKSVLDKNINIFCSQECANQYKIKSHREIRKCEYCNEEYETKINSKQRFCSMECQSKWQSETLVGENASGFNHDIPLSERYVNCDWCNELTIAQPKKLKRIKEEGARHFCSKECLREWYAKEWSQSEEWKLESSERAVKMLEDGVFGLESEAQRIVNRLLNELKIKYTNEYNCKYVSIDNYLTDYNLMIEVMGTYWHSDPRYYKEINYQIQVDRIKNDKIKSTYIKNNYSINILYLWEEEIMNDEDLCKELIKHYIQNKGLINNFHSFNYCYDNKLSLNENSLITPYMEYDIEELRKIINITGSKRKSMKQLDRWITFNCEQCGKEKEQLKKDYVKANHHFCSPECSHIFRKGKSRNSVI